VFHLGCVRRGLTCEYGISRRTGRNRAPSAVSINSVHNTLESGLPTPGRSTQPSNQSGTANGYSTHSRSASLSDSLSVYSPENAYRYFRSHTPQCMPPSPPLNTPAIIIPLGTPESSLAPVPRLAVDYWHTMEAGVDDLLVNMSSPNFTNAETTLDPNLSLLNMPHDSFMEFSLPMSEPTVSSGNSDHSAFDFNVFTPSFSSSSPSSRSSASIQGCTENTSNDGSLFTSTTGCCMLITLSMMSRLFPSAGSACTMLGASKSYGACQTRRIEAAILENKEVIQSLIPLLDCPCMQDEYILSIMALITFKILESYSALAGVDDSQQQPNASVGNLTDWSVGISTTLIPTTVGVAGFDRSLMTAQLVLSELQNVHRLVNALSLRLESIRLLNSSLYNSSLGSPKSSMPGSSPLSVPMFEQLEQNLRQRLKAVSSGVIEQMRHK
jgi:hypothetical protein